jgi:hypothetical protein
MLYYSYLIEFGADHLWSFEKCLETKPEVFGNKMGRKNILCENKYKIQ